MNDQQIQRTQAIDAFAQAVHPVLAPLGVHQHGPMGGHEWRWTNEAGAWSLTVGGAIDAGPIVMGPGRNVWHTAEYTLQHADLVLLMLQLAGALPGAPHLLAESGNVAVQNVAVRRPAPRAVGTSEPAETSAGYGGYATELAGSDLPARDTTIVDMPQRGQAYAVTQHRPDLIPDDLVAGPRLGGYGESVGPAE